MTFYFILMQLQKERGSLMHSISMWLIMIIRSLQVFCLPTCKFPCLCATWGLCAGDNDPSSITPFAAYAVIMWWWQTFNPPIRKPLYLKFSVVQSIPSYMCPPRGGMSSQLGRLPAFKKQQSTLLARREDRYSLVNSPIASSLRYLMISFYTVTLKNRGILAMGIP